MSISAWCAIAPLAFAGQSHVAAQAPVAPGSRARAAILGRVVDGDLPVAGADVRAFACRQADLLRRIPELPPDRIEITARTDAHGEFRIADIPAGIAVQLQASRADRTSVPIPAVRAGDTPRLGLLPAASVTLATCSHPGAQAVLMTLEPEVQRWFVAARAVAGTAADELCFPPTAGLAPGRYRLAATDAAGWVIDREIEVAPGVQKWPASLWHAGATARLRIRDATGRAVGRATAEVIDCPGRIAEAIAGEIALPGVPCNGLTWLIQVTVDSQIARVWWRPERPGVDWHTDVALPPARPIVVACQDADGRPVAALPVLAFATVPGSTAAPAAVAIARTDAAGHAVLQVPAADGVMLVAFAGSAGQAFQPAPDAGAAPEPCLLRLPRPTSCSLVVREPGAGGPVAGAEVVLTPDASTPLLPILTRRLYTDRVGRVSFAGLAPGRCQVEVWHRPFQSYRAEIDLPRGERDVVEVRLAPGLRLHGRVRDHTGAPAVEAWVSLRPRDPLTMTQSLSCTTGLDGTFSFTGLSAGDYILFASQDRGGHTFSCQLRDVAPGANPIEVDLKDEDPRRPDRDR